MEENKKLPSIASFTPLLIALLVIAAFVIGILWTRIQFLEGGGSRVAGTTTGEGTQAAPPAARPTTGNIRTIDDKNDHIRGDKNAKVTLVEYSDLECPFCKSFHPTMKRILEEYSGKVRWVYRHFPIDQIHPKARPAALASECVASIGGNDAFWNYVDRLFEGVPATLADEQLKTIAINLGIDENKFSSCFTSRQFENRVNADLQDGQTGGVTGTPGTFLIDAKGNKKLIPGALPYESVKAEVETALKN